MSGRSPPLYCTLILITMRSHQSYHNITTVIHSYEYSTTGFLMHCCCCAAGHDDEYFGSASDGVDAGQRAFLSSGQPKSDMEQGAGGGEVQTVWCGCLSIRYYQQVCDS